MYTTAYFVFLCRFLSLLPLFIPSFFSLLCSILFQTVLGVEMRSSRVSLSSRWRNSGTSVASGVEPVTWSLQESTSASECVQREKKEEHNIYKHFVFWKDTNAHAFHVWFLCRWAKLCFWHIKQFCLYSLYCRDGVPYCEADYHAQYGVKCETCNRYISGRVLEVRTKPDFSMRQQCWQRFSCIEFRSNTENQIQCGGRKLSVISVIRIEQLHFILKSI